MRYHQSMNLHTMLSKRSERGAPVRAGLVGAGKFGSMFLAQARLIKGISVVGVADIDAGKARDAFSRTGWPADVVVAANSSVQINDISSAGRIAITEDAQSLIEADLDVVVECTGIPEAGTIHALNAIDSGRHVVMVNVEADCLVGPLLAERARRVGVVYSMAYGDQPALICEMVDWAQTCGFEVTAAGKGTKYLPEYRYSTPDTVWGYYGFTPEQVAAGDFNAKMFNSFLDGTKSAIEMAAVANATGFLPQESGLSFPAAGVARLADVLKPETEGGVLTRSPTVEVVSCLERDGRPVDRDLRWGVYVTIKASTEYVRQCFGQYGVTTDKSGNFAALYRPSHFIGLELNISVASAALRNEPTGCPTVHTADAGSVAKRKLEPGEFLDGEGGYTVAGMLVPAEKGLASGILPIGLTSGAKVVRPVAQDGWITYDDVEITEKGKAWLLRQELERRSRS